MSEDREAEVKGIKISGYEGGFYVFLPPRLAVSFAEALRERGVRFSETPDAKRGLQVFDVPGEEKREELESILEGWKDWYAGLDASVEYDVGRIWAVASALSGRKLDRDEFETCMGLDSSAKLVENPLLLEYLAEWEVDGTKHHPFGGNLPSQKKAGAGKHGKHARQMGDQERKEKQEQIDKWEREIRDLMKTPVKGRKAKVKELKRKIKDLKEKMHYAGENHSQRDKGYCIPGLHEEEDGGEDKQPWER
jgi:hypothetical protein